MVYDSELLNSVRLSVLPFAKYKIYVGFSGGLDSHVLLHLMARLKNELLLDVYAVHVNHQLQSASNYWLTHCESVCEALNITLIPFALHIPFEKGDSREENARQARYEAFQSVINEQSILLTAHHQDDQAETLLLQLCRGAGLKGLAAMPVQKKFHQGFHLRPLLSCTRAQLHTYAKHYELQWIEDPSNQDSTLTRNYLRNEIMPMLQKRWQNVASTLSRVASHCADAQKIIDEHITQILEATKGTRVNTLSVRKLLALQNHVRREVLRHFILEAGHVLPSTKKILQIEADVLLAKRDKMPLVTWKQTEIRRFMDDLYILTPTDFIRTENKVWFPAQSTCEFVGIGTLKIKNKKAVSESLQFHVGFRKGGEKCKLPDRECHHQLKHLFQQWKVPPWERGKVPLLFFNDELIAAVPYFIDERFKDLEFELA